jgi:hypothetical protein
MRQFVQGCRAADAQLVNFQLELVDKVQVQVDEATSEPILDERGQPKLERHPDAHETWLQHLDGGAVARVRPSDRRPIAPLAPGEARSFAFSFGTSGRSMQGATVTLRLMFRPVPPYFLRSLAAHQPSNETPRIADYISNVHSVEMAKGVLRVE